MLLIIDMSQICIFFQLLTKNIKFTYCNCYKYIDF